MLFTSRALEGIRQGRITLAFRRWKRPTVKAGGTLRTAIGLLAIGRITRIDAASLSDADAHAAGYASLQDLVRDLSRRPEGVLYRVEIAPGGPDPRVALRNRDRLGRGEFEAVQERLARLDRSARTGTWTSDVLHTIDRHPGVPAATLAASLGRETEAFKRDVRKLKELGLTESLGTGYRLSPRGRAYVGRLARTPDR